MILLLCVCVLCVLCVCCVCVAGVQEALAWNNANAVQKPRALRKHLLQEVPGLLCDWWRWETGVMISSFFPRSPHQLTYCSFIWINVHLESTEEERKMLYKLSGGVHATCSLLLALTGCRRDKDGYYWITGRIDDMLNVSGTERCSRLISAASQNLHRGSEHHNTNLQPSGELFILLKTLHVSCFHDSSLILVSALRDTWWARRRWRRPWRSTRPWRRPRWWVGLTRWRASASTASSPWRTAWSSTTRWWSSSRDWVRGDLGFKEFLFWGFTVFVLYWIRFFSISERENWTNRHTGLRSERPGTPENSLR